MHCIYFERLISFLAACFRNLWANGDTLGDWAASYASFVP